MNFIIGVLIVWFLFTLPIVITVAKDFYNDIVKRK